MLPIRRIAALAFSCALLSAAPAFADDAETAANACLDGVGELYPQHRFTEAADKYLCAADALARVAGHEERAARYRANAWFYRSWGTYTQKPLSGPLGQENLADATRQVQQSLPLWQAAKFPVGERLSQAWLTYLNGVQAGYAGQYATSRDDFAQAREAFTRIGEDAPPLRELTDMMLSLAEDQTVFAEVMKAMADPAGYENQGGYIDSRLDDMKRRALPETRPYFDSLAAQLRAARQYAEAGDRLDAWDYKGAQAALGEAKKALDAARPGADAVPGESTRAAYKALLAGWAGIVDAELYHSAALEQLLAKGNTAKAKDELIAGVAAFRQAQASLEAGGMPSASIASSYRLLSERAAAVAQAFGPTRAAIIVGWTFFAFFSVTLGTLTMLRKRYLPLTPPRILWAALVVAIIAAFGLRAPEILQVVKPDTILKR